MLSRPKRVTEACTDSSLKELDVCKILWAFRSLGWVGTVEDDGTSLLDQWDLTEDAPSQAESPQETPADPVSPVSPEGPGPAGPEGPWNDAEPAPLPAMAATVEPIVETMPENEVDGAPSFDSHPAFPQVGDQTVAIPSPEPGLASIQVEPIVPSDAVEEAPPTGPIESTGLAGTAGQDEPLEPLEPVQQPVGADDPIPGLGPETEKPVPEAKTPAMVETDMDMDLDMDGLGEVLRGGESE